VSYFCLGLDMTRLRIEPRPFELRENALLTTYATKASLCIHKQVYTWMGHIALLEKYK